MRGLARFEDGLRGEEWNGRVRGAWSGMEGFEERGAALRGHWGVRVHHHPQGESELGLSLRAVSDLGRGHMRDGE